MTKYYVEFTMDGGSDILTIYTIIESEYDLNMTTSELVRAVCSAEFFTADKDPEYYRSRNPGRVTIRTSKVINIIVREA